MLYECYTNVISMFHECYINQCYMNVIWMLYMNVIWMLYTYYMSVISMLYQCYMLCYINVISMLYQCYLNVISTLYYVLLFMTEEDWWEHHLVWFLWIPLSILFLIILIIILCLLGKKTATNRECHMLKLGHIGVQWEKSRTFSYKI